MPDTITLRLSSQVSDALLPDLRALLPAEAMQFFSNQLDEQWHYTLLCVRGEETCALIVSAILLWRLLGKIHQLQYRNAESILNLSAADQHELFRRLNMPQAVLHIS